MDISRIPRFYKLSVDQRVRVMRERGLLTKEGGREAMDHYFHQVAHMGASAADGAEGASASPSTPDSD